MGVDHSVVSHNISENNAGGILLSDDTGATHDNLITGNAVRNNPFDCGVTLASHGPATITGAALPFGVFHNTISDNESARNGLHVPGAGAGVGIFAPFPGTKAYGNVVTHNRLIGNGLPGVAMHNHASFPMAPPVDLSSNVIVGNFFLGNGADTEDAATPGPTGINIFSIAPVIGTVIAENVFVDEAVDVAVSTPSLVELHLNNLRSAGSIGVDNLGAGMINATENWWGCPAGPGGAGCSSVNGSVVFSPWLTKPVPDNDDH
jgi:hypothetical protein